MRSPCASQSPRFFFLIFIKPPGPPGPVVQGGEAILVRGAAPFPAIPALVAAGSPCPDLVVPDPDPAAPPSLHTPMHCSRPHRPANLPIGGRLSPCRSDSDGPEHCRREGSFLLPCRLSSLTCQHPDKWRRSCLLMKGRSGSKTFSPKRGLIFTVNGASAPLPPPPPNSPYIPLAPPPPLLEDHPPPGIFSKTPTAFQEKGGEGARGRGWGGGGAEAPFTAKTSPLFGENALSRVETNALLGAQDHPHLGSPKLSLDS